MVITASLRNFKETGYPLIFKQWPTLIENIWEMGLVDGAMVGSVMLCLPLHRLYANSNGSLRWNNLGWIIQSLFQATWLGFWVTYPFARNWTWTAQVFFTLHFLSMFMKMHSYAFYNGHLSETRRRLRQLDNPAGQSRAEVVKYPSSSARPEALSPTSQRKQNASDEDRVRQLREDLATELTSPLGHVTYPQNLTFENFADYICCPTLCYELEYPRTPKTDWMELFYKSLAVFGCIFLITLTTEEFVLPVLEESAARLHTRTGLSEGSLIMAETISRLLFPFMCIFLLVFLVIFEYLLGAFAEITRFADRRFYSDWWNSCDWLEFSREWNIPVHNFLNRHVYSVSRGRVSRQTATLITFFTSALAHELVMGSITKKLRGYGFFAMMLQMPIVMIQRSRWVRGRTLLNNVLFWCSMILGLSMVC
jgi:sterol O-acyltransferase